MTAEQMKKLKELVLKTAYYDFDTNRVEVSDNEFFDLIEWVDNYKKEVIK